MDKIIISGLTAEAILGVYPWEQQMAQKIRINMEIAIDISEAVRTDDVAFALDYKQVANYTVDFIQKNRFALIETLASQLASDLFAQFPFDWIRLQITKPQALRFADDVGLQIERTRPRHPAPEADSGAQ